MVMRVLICYLCNPDRTCRPWRLLLVLLLAAASCRSADVQPEARSEATLTVFAAASLTDAFTQIGERFSDSYPGQKVIFNFAGSQQLAQQLVLGAPVDVFASADEFQMQVVVESGRAFAASVQPFAGNRLVVITPVDNPAGVDALADLAMPGVKLVLAAGEVPAGRYTLDFLRKAGAASGFPPGFQDLALGNTVSFEADVRAVLAKVALGEADAGVVYASDAARAGSEVQVVAIPPELNVLARYLIAPLQDAGQRELAEAFIGLVLSPEGQEILAGQGLQPVIPGMLAPAEP
jgi:molybdate transport system substrate-binding protein